MKPAFLRLFIAAAVFAFNALAQDAAIRPWKDAQGRIIQAAYVSATADSVTLKMADGKEHQIPLTRLSAEDQAFVKSLTPAAPSTAQGTTPAVSASSLNRLPIDKRTWPENVIVPTSPLRSRSSRKIRWHGSASIVQKASSSPRRPSWLAA